MTLTPDTPLVCANTELPVLPWVASGCCAVWERGRHCRCDAHAIMPADESVRYMFAREEDVARDRCWCESSLCDHDADCQRPADARLTMAYVGTACTQCCANMCATGGGQHVSLREASP